ncbi:protoheme IX farnesyltransferase [Microvirga tunisiensis]|uniref:Protoheme IX farnesyltransferase n=1 Tax=Pannonibacter tanglangensis TaxID=2750084 RepID=A0A7X5F393_9HYPH|nr:heme o synthase [Pannonibacter sp. XCT-53]NBN78968.1 protoheme IX farnesyltransferase [Pannonibacter sp. XCT-53]
MSLVERPDTMIDDPVTWQGGMGSVGDYVALLKPRVMSLVIFTAFVGMMLAPGSLHPVVAGVALLCIAIGAGASGALNMWYDADIDRIMSRTAKRPIPAGKITPDEALAFGMTLSIGSVVMLGLLVNWFAGAFLAFTIFFYAVIYTMWLKRSTPQNIVIGGAAGAFPPMIGWASVTGSVSLESVILFLIIFMWTPPHFWALALFKSNDYRQAGVPMLPVVAGEDATRTQILLYSLVLVPLAISPWPLGFAGPVYGVVATALGAGFLGLAWRVYRLREGDAARKAAVRLFSFSILYLFLLFALLLGESLVTRMM